MDKPKSAPEQQPSTLPSSERSSEVETLRTLPVDKPTPSAPARREEGVVSDPDQR
jgi:hypothetical protein